MWYEGNIGTVERAQRKSRRKQNQRRTSGVRNGDMYEPLLEAADDAFAAAPRDDIFHQFLRSQRKAGKTPKLLWQKMGRILQRALIDGECKGIMKPEIVFGCEEVIFCDSVGGETV